MPHGKAVAYVECAPRNLEGLQELAERVDKLVGHDPPENGYGLAECVASVLNGGSIEEIQAAFALLKGWSFEPQGGWMPAREGVTL